MGGLEWTVLRTVLIIVKCVQIMEHVPNVWMVSMVPRANKNVHPIAQRVLGMANYAINVKLTMIKLDSCANVLLASVRNLVEVLYQFVCNARTNCGTHTSSHVARVANIV